jgi:peptidylprolyl isomerase
VRTTAGFVLAGLVAASLAACSSPAQVHADCVPAAPGAASEAVKVSGAIGAKPTVEFTAPLTAKTTQRSVAIAGKNTKLYAGTNDEVSLDFSLYNGTTGDLLTATDYTDGNQAQFNVNEGVYLVGLIKTIACSTVGSRVIGVIPPSEAFGSTGSTDLGVTADQSLVFVADIVSVTPGVATGVPQDPTPGMPKVKLDKNGAPTITIPDSEPPTDLQIALLKKGDGTVVAEGDTVKLQYVGVDWQTKAVFDQSWDSKGPVSLTTGGVVPGFGQALIGQAVGSQVLVVIPPALGYGSAGNSDAKIGGTDTIVFVIDILGTAPTTTG